MGLLMTLEKENNVLYHDFHDAYWAIEDLRFQNDEGDSYTLFSLRAYPSREAKLKKREIFNSTLSFGGAESNVYSTVLYSWDGVLKTELVFPEGIPISEQEQKDAMYPFVISYLNLGDYTPVFEEGQEPS